MIRKNQWKKPLMDYNNREFLWTVRWKEKRWNWRWLCVKMPLATWKLLLSDNRLISRISGLKQRTNIEKEWHPLTRTTHWRMVCRTWACPCRCRPSYGDKLRHSSGPGKRFEAIKDSHGGLHLTDEIFIRSSHILQNGKTSRSELYGMYGKREYFMNKHEHIATNIASHRITRVGLNTFNVYRK